MANYRKTQRGQTIDIDLIRMKHELEHTKKNKNSMDREQDVNARRRRKGNENSKIAEMLANQELIRKKLKDKKPVDDKEVEEKKDKPELTTHKRIIKNNGNVK